MPPTERIRPTPRDPHVAGVSHSTPESIDLAVRVGAVQLKNPLLTASGTFGYGVEYDDVLDVSVLGGVVTKTITRRLQPGHPPPRIAETPSGMLNSIGLENVGLERFIAEKLPLLATLPTAAVVSLGGHSVDDFAEMARAVDGAPNVVALELNISCPNLERGGALFCADPAMAASVVEAVRRVARLPLWAKLSPNVTDIGAVALACERAGADALTVANTFVGMAVDVERRQPVIPRVTAGVSGPAIRPLALAKVWETLRATTLPVVGIGGIGSAHDVLEFLITGACAVQVGTVLFSDPTAPVRILADLCTYCSEHGLARLADVVGTLRVPQSARAEPRDARPATDWVGG
jgi:dihydroorotate dehydrogenase (NAD+) catalytic subunit